MKASISLKPISVNHAYGTNKYGRRYLVEAGKRFKQDFAWLFKVKVGRIKLDKASKFSVGIKFYFKDKRRRDVDDYGKNLIDSLTGIVWEDDCQIYHLELLKEQGCSEDKIEIEIKPIK